jgi:hypothetical protein
MNTILNNTYLSAQQNCATIVMFNVVEYLKNPLSESLVVF